MLGCIEYCYFGVFTLLAKEFSASRDFQLFLKFAARKVTEFCTPCSKYTGGNTGNRGTGVCVLP